MDALAGLLEGPRANRAFLMRSILDPPWSLRIEDGAPLTLIAVVRGAAWAVPERGEPIRMRPGDVAIASGPAPYTMSSDPAEPPTAFILPGNRTEDAQGNQLCAAMNLGVRTWGNSEDGETVMVTGTYEPAGEISRRLLAALPALAVVPFRDGDSPLVTLFGDEVVKDRPGQEVFLDRMLDLLLVATLRDWFARPDSAAPAWYQAQGDPVVGPALRLLHNNSAHPWTVALLATHVGVSRAALARRFTELVGESPMAYLTGWRLSLAADLLRESSATLDSVARKVGYGSAFALSNAFKRERGVSPRQYRAALAS
jgi:AraC-like DNA-binding protein